MSFAVRDGVARLEVADRGVGFDTPAPAPAAPDGSGYGMLSMAERAELVGGALVVSLPPPARR